MSNERTNEHWPKIIPIARNASVSPKKLMQILERDGSQEKKEMSGILEKLESQEHVCTATLKAGKCGYFGHIIRNSINRILKQILKEM